MFQPVQVFVPMGFKMSHPVLYLAHGIELHAPGVNAVARARIRQPYVPNTSAFLMGNKAGALQDAQMFVNGRQGDVKIFGKLAHRSFALGKPLKHSAPGGITQGKECGIQRLSPILSHVAKY